MFLTSTHNYLMRVKTDSKRPANYNSIFTLIGKFNMKKTFVINIAAFLALINVVYADVPTIEEQFRRWEIFCDNLVEGDVSIPVPTNRQMRNTDLTGVFQPLEAHGFRLIDAQPIQEYHKTFQIQVADYSIDGESQRSFILEYVTSSDMNIGGLVALTYLTEFYSNRSGKLFQQYKSGLGDVCFIDRFSVNTITTNPEAVQNIWFSRDNVAVRIRSYHGYDILTFARLLDECILALSVDKDDEDNGIPPADTLSINDNEAQQTNALYTTIKNQTLSLEETAPSSVSTEEEKAIPTKSLNRIWLYLGIGVLFLLALFYFIRKKPKQGNP